MELSAIDIVNKFDINYKKNKYNELFAFKINNEYVKWNVILKAIDNIFESNIDDINILLIEHLTVHLFDINPQKFTDIFIFAFNKITKKIYDDLNNDIIQNKPISDIFSNIYSEFNKNIKFIKKIFWYYDSNILHNKNTKYSNINLMAYCSFYLNVINNKYDNIVYLYDLINAEILLNPNDINKFKFIFKINIFYSKLLYVSLNSDNTDEKLQVLLEKNNSFLLNISSNEIFITHLAKHIHNLIQNLTEYNKFNFDFIFNIIEIINNFKNENCKYNLFHNNFLSIRLINNTNITKEYLNFENNIINSLYFRNHELKYIMKTKINNILNSELINNLFLNVPITKIVPKSQKYIDFDMNNVNKHICNFKTLDNRIWKLNNNNINIPTEISIYYDIYSSIYKKHIQYKNIYLNYENTTCDIELTIKDKSINVNLNLLCIVILMNIIKYGQITCEQLIVNLEVSQVQINNSIDTLLTNNLINNNNNIIKLVQ
jgi:hypothetical protein